MKDFNKIITDMISDNYAIKRFYAPGQKKADIIVQRGLTLEDAKKHCCNPKTKKAGEYFEGYIKEE